MGIIQCLLANDRHRAIAVMALATAYIAGGSAFFANGMERAITLREPRPRTPIERRALEVAKDHAPHSCEYRYGDGPCRRPDASVVIWGDSLASAWGGGMEADTYSWPRCLPAVGQDGIEGKCRGFNDAVAKRINGRTVVLVGRWQQHSGWDLSGTFESLRGVRVLVIGPTPFLRAPVPECIRRELDCNLPRATFDLAARPILAKLRAQAKPFPNVEVVDVTDRFCTQEYCPAILAGVALYYDNNHPTITQAKRVLPSML